MRPAGSLRILTGAGSVPLLSILVSHGAFGGWRRKLGRRGTPETPMLADPCDRARFIREHGSTVISGHFNADREARGATARFALR